MKTKITINLALLLLLGMFLTDFVMVRMTQRDMIRAEMSRGSIFLSAVEKEFTVLFVSENPSPRTIDDDHLDRMLTEAGFSCAMVMDPEKKTTHALGAGCEMKDKLEAVVGKTMTSGKRTTEFQGTTWGVFWKQPRHLILSVPFIRNGAVMASAGVVLPLDGIYGSVRQTQYILIIYVLVNTVILTLIGLYRLSVSTVRPLNRLAKRAGEYSDEDELFFLYEKEGSEYNKLSKALNSMLKSISEDKKKLRQTVLYLEKANLDLKQAQKDIIRAEKLASVGRLSSGIAHEIGNPIGIIIGYLELIKQDDIPEDERREFIERAENEVNRVNRIIRQLLDLSRRSKEGLESVSVHGIIKEVIDVLKVQPGMPDIAFQLNLTSEKNTVMADPHQLRQVFLNLVMNAADAIFSNDEKVKGKLVISSEEIPGNVDDGGAHSPMIKIMFIDNGPGIPEGIIKDIFDPFYTTKEPGKGTGLGLSVSFMIIDGIGGKIKAESKEGRGTTMTIYLPLVPDTSAPDIS
ncbi:sensor histidine kinase [Thermodesulfobacteriota bacterium]